MLSRIGSARPLYWICLPAWINIANLLTLARLAAAPFAIVDILHGQHQRALVIVLVAALTDTADGTIARRFGVVTTVGSYFDPIVDKLFLSGVYLALAEISTVPWWLVIEIFVRDLLILGVSGTLLLLDRRRQFPPSIWGKASTFFQITCALAIIVSNAFPGGIPAVVLRVLVLLVTGFTAFSGCHYVWREWRRPGILRANPYDHVKDS